MLLKNEVDGGIEPFMPEAETAHLRSVYEEADVILEYGSGGSTQMAAQMPQKFIMSSESDKEWARSLRHKLSLAKVQSRVIVHHVDIGETGPWGRPQSSLAWRKFFRYPNDIWDQVWFRHPDVILIDGRFRVACLVTSMLRIERPTLVLFDDYGVRPLYHEIEDLIRPRRMIGRMAEFMIEPKKICPEDVVRLLFSVSLGSICGINESFYTKSVDQVVNEVG
ncbi:MAG: hypothetical protein Q4G36_04300 [Paracoccus sp. (in: a-proteobacteria)]|nr:hypothetical protein [Paracoccus sp. (in: a-proteobacteria)]